MLSVLQAEPEPSLNWVPCILDKLQHGAWINPHHWSVKRLAMHAVSP
ncbi:MAG: hypothetical protein ACK4P5_09905 [Fimbriimonadales bacterium]